MASSIWISFYVDLAAKKLCDHTGMKCILFFEFSLSSTRAKNSASELLRYRMLLPTCFIYGDNWGLTMWGDRQRRHALLQVMAGSKW